MSPKITLKLTLWVHHTSLILLRQHINMRYATNQIRPFCSCMLFIYNRGESGSGKSESTRMIIRHLCDLSKTSKKKTKLHSTILKVDSILCAFGNATTPFNSDATCVTRFSEIQFQKGKMVGLKTIHHLLDTSRISGIGSDGGFCFHIIYYLLDGATSDERAQLNLLDAAHFQYLNHTKLRTASFAQKNGVAQMETLRANLKTLGIGRRMQRQIWQVLAAVLHIGNITFQASKKAGEPCTIKNTSQLQLVANMLGVTPQSLQSVLTCRLRYIGRDAVSGYLDAAAAAQQRDVFARNLYNVLFSWVVEQINLKLCAAESAWESAIDLMEVPGFAGTESGGNTFYRLLMNYSNERILSHVFNDISDLGNVRLEVQGLPAYANLYESNNSTIALLSGPKNAILNIMDMETARGNSDEKMTSLFYTAHIESNPKFIAASSKKMAYSFGIRHYGGIVDYDDRGFTEMNRDVLQASFVTLIRGSPEEKGTSKTFIRNLFSDKLIATRNDRDGKNVMSASNRSRFPSLRRRRTTTSNSRMDEDDEEVLDVSTTVSHNVSFY